MRPIHIICTISLALVSGTLASTFVVNNIFDPGNGTCDAGGCTLREAIAAANANPGADTIEFNIPGTAVHTVALTSALPDITESVTIDGYTQPGSSENTLAVGENAVLLIELDGTAASASGLNLLADDCVIRGLVINRFDSSGIALRSHGNIIEGNLIGLDATGTASLGNGAEGVFIGITGGSNLVGGPLPAARNVISGNGGAGLFLCCGTADNLIQGNYIGTDAAGAAPLPNTQSGITLQTATDTLVGGIDSGAGNLISGNAVAGVLMEDDATGNTVQNNYIGVDASGTIALGNASSGVEINHASSNTIGGMTATARNIISGNTDNGVELTNSATGNVVQGNYIGTDASGSIDLGNSQNGVAIIEASDNLIGGSAPGAGNLISGNVWGVQISASTASTGNVIEGNLIGTDAAGAHPLGNILGILLFQNSASTIVGGTAGAGNTIAYNEDGGIAVNSASSGNLIFGNSIFSNGGLGIDLNGGSEDPNGVTANDFPDSDTGANELQNYPLITAIIAAAEKRSVQGELSSNANTAYTLDFYSNREVDPSGYGEGETWLGSLTVQTDAQGEVLFNFPLEAGSLGRYITATATDPNGNSSEFSIASEIVPPLSRFLNISTRLRVQTGDNVLIGGFIIDGTEAKEVIVRAIGPSLGDFGVADPLANPILELNYPDGTTVVTNNNWRDDQETEIEATGLAPSDDLEAAILVTLEPGAYTAIVRGVNSATGVALVETYDLSSGGDSALANISTRGLIETGDNVMIGGIIVGPDTAPSGSILLRGIGPSLGDLGITNPLADPMLELRDGNGALVTANDNWRSTQEMAIEATGLAPSDDLEAAILADLVAGPYTAILSGLGDATGIGLVEAYHLD